jgi:hypothetical protein
VVAIMVQTAHGLEACHLGAADQGGAQLDLLALVADWRLWVALLTRSVRS